jgi:hypothetical protein
MLLNQAYFNHQGHQEKHKEHQEIKRYKIISMRLDLYATGCDVIPRRLYDDDVPEGRAISLLSTKTTTDSEIASLQGRKNICPSVRNDIP